MDALFVSHGSLGQALFINGHEQVVPARTASITLVSPAGTAIAPGPTLKFAWFDQPTPERFGAPTDTGTVTIGDGGALKVPLANSAKASGQVGWLVVTDSDGDPDTVHKAFSGPVKVD